MEFRDFDEKDNNKYREYYVSCIQMAAEMTPINLLSMRGEPSLLKRAYAYDLCFHYGQVNDKAAYLCPVGDWDTADWKTIFEKEFPSGSYFWGIPELLAKKWKGIFGDSIELEESRDDWDYVWYTKRMSEAKGSALRSYRHDRNRFLNRYNCIEEKLTPAHFEEIRHFHNEQVALLLERTTKADMVVLDANTFEAALDYWDDRYLYGTIYRIDGEIGGVVINEIIDENNVVGLYQKQNRKFVGIAEYISISDCQHLIDNGYMVLNIMSDVGAKGLREVKMRSAPLVMLKKYHITVK